MILFLHIYILCSYPIAVDIVLVCCYIMVVGDWFAWSVAAMVGSECVAFFLFVCLFVCLFIYFANIHENVYVYIHMVTQWHGRQLSPILHVISTKLTTCM